MTDKKATPPQTGKPATQPGGKTETTERTTERTERQAPAQPAQPNQAPTQQQTTGD